MAVQREDQLLLAVIRAGKTKSGGEERLLGWEDEPLLESERGRIIQRAAAGVYPSVARVYTSTLVRAMETAHLIYGEIPPLVTMGMEPYDYGKFEGKTMGELMDNPDYQAILTSKQLLASPEGESPYTFNARIGRGFKRLVEEISHTKVRKVALVVHQSVVDSLVRQFVVPRSLRHNTVLEYAGGILLLYHYQQDVCEICGTF